MRRRTRARESALKILYAINITHNDVQYCCQDFFKTQGIDSKEVRDFAEYLVYGVQKNIQEIDRIISQYAANWQIERMAAIDRNVMRLAAFELLYAEEIPAKVTINEAVEIAKKYGDKDSGKFVNGILDKIHREEVSGPDKGKKRRTS